jgi:hypothetical protein
MGIDQRGESNNGNSNSNIDLRTSLQPPPSTSPPATATNRNNNQPRVITSSHFNCSPPFLLPICADRWFRTVQKMGSTTSSTTSTPPGRRSDHHQPPPKKIHHQTNAECQPPSCFVLTMHRYQINTEDDPPSCFSNLRVTVHFECERNPTRSNQPVRSISTAHGGSRARKRLATSTATEAATATANWS